MSGFGTITLNYTSALLQPGSKSLKGSIKFVGPSIEARPDTTNFPFHQIEQRGSKPLIYISLGTVINNNRAFYANCLQAFAQTDYQVIMSIGGKIESDSLGGIPANFIVRNFVPQIEILQKSDLFITHAGMNSVHEGLYNNVPLLLVPQQAEQGLVASRVQDLGAGLNLATADPTAAQLHNAVRQILHDSRFRDQARIVGESLRTAGGYRRAADEIVALGSQH